MSLWESILSLIDHGPFVAEVALLAPIASGGLDRRGLAAQAHGAIESSLHGRDLAP